MPVQRPLISSKNSGIPILNILGIIGNLKVFFQVAASFLL
jgi:hypothetical protein